ncbi:transposase [Singulisphaera sp. PoT]|uniref:transposase n=1 Tax=Singulisphaera sp. PoT TaxID=3411797 RepID=UPI003BF4B100
MPVDGRWPPWLAAISPRSSPNSCARAHPPGGRRHRHRASRPSRLWQGTPSRSGPLDPYLYRVPLGHKWVVLALLVPVPWAARRWALPLLIAPYRPKPENQKRGQRHKTPPQLLGQLIRVLMRWFPDRTWVVTAGGGYATHELAELAARTPERLTLVSLFHPDANLVEPAPRYTGLGRPRVKGAKLPGPADIVAGAERRQALKPRRTARSPRKPGSRRPRKGSPRSECAPPRWVCQNGNSRT